MRAAAGLLLTCLLATPIAAADTTLGTGVTLDTATPIGDVIATPAGFAGQTIRVEGVVTAVCEHMGCWMTLAPAGATAERPATLRLKVDDGVIVFPVSSRGKTAVAQGVIERVGGDDHHETAGPTQSYQLKVTGALLR